MKKTIVIIGLMFALATAVPLFGDTTWTINDAHTTMTDGTWTLNITGYPDLTITGFSASGATLVLNDNYVDSQSQTLQGVHIYEITTVFRNSQLTNLEIDLPELRVLGANGYESGGVTVGTFQSTSLTDVRINAPECRFIGTRTFYQLTMNQTSFDNWNLPKVEWLGKSVTSQDAPGTNGGSTGTLNLPSLKTIDQEISFGGGLSYQGAATVILGNPYSSDGYTYLPKSFLRHSGAVEIQLLSPQLKDIGSDCFYQCTSLKKLTLGGRRIESVGNDNAFAGGISVDEVTFLGAVPASVTVLNRIINGTGSYKIWYVSRNQDGWTSLSGLETDQATIVADANYASLTADQKANLIGRYYNSGKKKYVWLVHRASPYDNELADGARLTAYLADCGRETLAVSPAAGANGLYAVGTSVTLTAPAPALAGSAFVGWTGDVPENVDALSRTITVTMDRHRTLRAVYSRNWVYDGTSQILDNGIWTFNTSSNGVGGITIKATVRGCGRCELNDNILDPSGNPSGCYLAAINQYSAVAGALGAFSMRIVPEVIIRADHVTKMPKDFIRGSHSCTNAVFDCCDMNYYSGCMFYGNGDIVKSLTIGGEAITDYQNDQVVAGLGNCRDITVYGQVLVMGLLEKLVQKVPAYSHFHVSRRQGWGVVDGLEKDIDVIKSTVLSEYNKLSEDDKDNLIGLYTYNWTESGVAKTRSSWFIHTPSKYDDASAFDLVIRGVDTSTDAEVLIGTVSPAYGQYMASSGAEEEYSADEYAANGDILYRAIGYVRETFEGDVYSAPVTNFSRTFTHVMPEANERVSWLFERCGYKLDVSVQDAGTEAITVVPSPVFESHYLTGTEVTVSAPNSDIPLSVFNGWIGDLPANASPMTQAVSVTMDKARKLQATYSRKWLYDSVTGRLYDGNWSFTVSEDAGGGLSLTAKPSAGKGPLHLCDEIYSPDGTRRLTNYVASLGGTGYFFDRPDLTEVIIECDHVTQVRKDYFRSCLFLTNAVFACRSLTRMSDCVFYGDNVQYFTLGGDHFEEMFTEGAAPGDWHGLNLRELRVLGDVLPSAVLSEAVSHTQDYGIWRVSKKTERGWRNLANVVDRNTALANPTYAAKFADLSAEDQQACFGIYVGGRHFWMIHAPSPYDPVTGTVIIVK